MKPTYTDHSRVDERSLAMHRLVARKLLADPALLDRARDNLRRWQDSDGSPKPALAEGWPAVGGEQSFRTPTATDAATSPPHQTAVRAVGVRAAAPIRMALAGLCSNRRLAGGGSCCYNNP